MLKLFDWVNAPNSKALLGADHHGLTDQHRRYSDGHSSRVMWIAMSILSSSRWHQTCSLLYGPSSQKMKTKIQNAMAWKHLKDFFNWKCALTFYSFSIGPIIKIFGQKKDSFIEVWIWEMFAQKTGMQTKALETRHFQSITFPNSALLAQKNHCAQHVPSHLAEHFSGEAFVRNPPNKIQWTSFCCCCSSENL